MKLLTRILFLVSCMALLTACNRDSERAEVLFGEWEGYWGMYYETEYRGRIYVFYSDYSDIVFYPDHKYATWGDGYQVDWYSVGPYSSISLYFTWEVRNGAIYLTYPGYPEYNADIYDYYLDDFRFRGYFGGSGESFDMYLLRAFDWAPYRGYTYHTWAYDPWVWDGYNGYYYTRSTSHTEDKNAFATESKEGRILRIGNRFKDTGSTKAAGEFSGQ